MDEDQALRDFARALTELRDSSELFRARLVSNNQEARALKSLGILNASPWFKNNKYLYLVFPVKGDGLRERRYIGANSEKVEEAMAAISRAKRVAEIKKENDLLMSKLTLACQLIESLNKQFNAELVL